MGFLASNGKTYSLVHGNVERHYYKYQYDNYTNPSITSSLGNPDFQVISATQAGSSIAGYVAFDGNVNTQLGYYYHADTSWAIVYVVRLGSPVKLTSVRWLIVPGDTENHQWGDRLTVWGSNDGSSWTTVAGEESAGNQVWDYTQAINTNGIYYTFYKLQQRMTGHDNDETGTKEIYLTGQVQSVIDGTSTDYDFYKDTYVNYTLKHGTKTF